MLDLSPYVEAREHIRAHAHIRGQHHDVTFSGVVRIFENCRLRMLLVASGKRTRRLKIHNQ